MATVTKWTPFGVALDITATAGTVTRTSATQFKVVINASWACSSSSNKTDYGMTASSGGGSVTLNTEGTKSNGSTTKTFTGTYSISGNGSATKTITVTFKNFNTWHNDEATKSVSFNVTVPAWTSYVVVYNANGGTGAPSYQTKWSGQTLTLSSTKPTRTGYTFLGWSTSSTATSATYSAGGSFTSNADTTLYAVWKANTYTVSYNANGGADAPSSQTKTYGTTLTLSSTKPTRTNYTFLGWGTSASSTTVAYAAGANYTANAAITLYAIWSMSYTKPRITNLTVTRCNYSGTATNTGTYARVKFNWACDKSVSDAWIDWGPNLKVLTLSGTSGNVNEIVGGSLQADKAYSIYVYVEDSGGLSDAKRTLYASAFTMDCLPNYKGIAFGKEAELENYADFYYRVLARNGIYIPQAQPIYGIMPDLATSYSALIPLTDAGNTSLGYGLYNASKGSTHIYGNEINFYTKQKAVNMNSNHLRFGSNHCIYGTMPDGSYREAINPINSYGNTIIGWDNYDKADGYNTNIYGYDLTFGVSNIANPGTYRPYFRRGMSFSTTIRTVGYCTNSKKEVYFVIPISRPIIGTPTITITSGTGFIIRQGDKYTHGSASGTWVTPASYDASFQLDTCIQVKATFSDVTNATNNDTVGIQWNGTITLT